VVTTGDGFQSASESDPVAEPLAWLTAAIVTGFCAGITAGAVYKPLGEIVPREADPPETPFTSHVTLLFVEPPIVAVNCVVDPSRVCGLPLTETVTASAVGVAAAGAKAPPVEQPANAALAQNNTQ
jgi:hypothetical protein